MKHLNCLCSDNNGLVIFFSRLLTKFRTFTRKLCWEKVHLRSNKRLQFQDHHHKQLFPDQKIYPQTYHHKAEKTLHMLYFQKKKRSKYMPIKWFTAQGATSSLSSHIPTRAAFLGFIALHFSRKGHFCTEPVFYPWAKQTSLQILF